jgi:hypothetical protein
MIAVRYGLLHAAVIGGMEPQVMHISEADSVRNVRAILQQVQKMEPRSSSNATPYPGPCLRSAAPVRLTISECIAVAKAREDETGLALELDPDFAADVGGDRSQPQTVERPSWN